MATQVVIDHERYGMRQEFETVQAAQQAIRDCGPEFSDVEFSDDGQNVYDERDELVGTVNEKNQTYDFETTREAEEWAHGQSLTFDTDEECQRECERLLRACTIRERDGERA